jgi:hypothetical protein
LRRDVRRKVFLTEMLSRLGDDQATKAMVENPVDADEIENVVNRRGEAPSRRARPPSDRVGAIAIVRTPGSRRRVPVRCP